jgi:Flp pilus assembly pilin Flp
MSGLIAKFLGNESGATAVEYSLLFAGIADVIVAAAQLWPH